MSERVLSNEQKHTLHAMARTHAEIGGVSEVIAFDEECVSLRTDCGEMTVEGEGLHIGTLDIARGVVCVDGKINAVLYTDGEVRRRGLRARLFG